MLHTRTSIEYRDSTIAAVVPAVVGNSIVSEVGDRHARLAAERALDEVLADSFPASDPPSWNPGIVRPGPAGHVTRGAAPAEDAERTLPSADVVAVSRPAHADRTFLQALASLARCREAFSDPTLANVEATSRMEAVHERGENDVRLPD